MPTDLGERPVSPFRNLVTQAGLKQIEDEIARLQAALAAADDKSATASTSRDLRYWIARRESAEVSVPDADGDVVRFGMIVDLEDEEGKTRQWKIVGEDEADPTSGSISHVSPVAMTLFGKPEGDVVMIGGRPWEIVTITTPKD